MGSQITKYLGQPGLYTFIPIIVFILYLILHGDLQVTFPGFY